MWDVMMEFTAVGVVVNIWNTFCNMSNGYRLRDWYLTDQLPPSYVELSAMWFELQNDFYGTVSSKVRLARVYCGPGV